MPPNTATHTPDPFRACLRYLGDRDAHRGGAGAGGYIPSSHPHNGAYTRVLPVLPGLIGG